MTTRPLTSRRASMGSLSSARSAGFSRSRYVVGPFCVLMICRARVVFPTCRAPMIATTLLWERSRRIAWRAPGHFSMGIFHLENSMEAIGISSSSERDR